MQIIVAKYAGFCPGVKRAWNLVSREAGQSTFILGELIHNRQAIKRLKDWGIKTIEKTEDLKGKKGIVFIRAHGEPPSTFQKLAKMKRIKVVDATCPSVARVQKLAKQIEDEGYQVFVCGEKDHSEARATVGYTKKGKIISSVAEARKIAPAQKIGVVSQTTFSSLLFAQICQILKKKCQEFKSLGTICNFTQLAQKEAQEVAKKVDVVIVVGGKQSSNTKRLAEVASEIVKTYHVEMAEEIKKEWLIGAKRVGLLAGASTPEWVIREVKKTLSSL